MKAILRFACVAGLISSLPCAAQTFGDLHATADVRPFAPSGLLADPDVAKWLMTLPSDAALEPAAPEATIEAQLLDPAPIGGEVYHFAAAAPAVVDAPAVAETPAIAALSPQMFAAHPIGRQARSIRPRAEPSRTVAEIAAPKAARPALQGRSVAKRAVRRAHQARPAAATVAHAARPRLGCSRCGLQTGRSAAVPARDWRLQSEGSADLPAPRGPAGLVTIVPF
jgi:hypothetical protein